MISKIRPLHLQEYYAKKLKTGLSNRSVQYHHTIIHKALKQAVRWQMIPYNPADGVQAPRPRRKEQSIIPSEKIPEFLMAIRSDHFYDLVYTALRTGMRRGELLGLRWEDVDLKEKAIHVVQSLRWVAGECHFEDVKTEHSRRSIPIPKALVSLLTRQKTGQAAEKLQKGEQYNDRGLVFCGPLGAPWCPSTVTHHFHDLAGWAGYPGIRFHDLRHTFASMLLKKGVHPKVVQELLGHASITTTMDTYSHLLPTIKQDAVDQLDDVFEAPAKIK